MNRRDFLKGAAALAMLSPFARFTPKAQAATSSRYNVFFISDPHLGSADSYNTDPSVGDISNKIKDTAGNVSPSKLRRGDNIMPVFNMMMRTISSKMDSTTAFILSGGDLIEGLSRTSAVQQRTLHTAFEDVRRFTSRVPFIPVCGNHDANGTGSGEGDAYREWNAEVIPLINNSSLGVHIDETTGAQFAMMYEGDLWIFLDCYAHNNTSTAGKFALQAIEDQNKKGGFRYLFICQHPNWLVTSGNWNVSFVNNFIQYNPIVLCGHSHENKYMHLKNSCGEISQFVVSTYISGRTAIGGKTTTYSNPDANTGTQELIPYLDEYVKYSSGAGYSKLVIANSGVTVELYGTIASAAPIRIKLR